MLRVFKFHPVTTLLTAIAVLGVGYASWGACSCGICQTYTDLESCHQPFSQWC